MPDYPQDTLSARYTAHRAENTDLKTTMDRIYQRLDAVGTTLDATDPEVVTLAEAVIADLEQLREQAVELRVTRDYIYYSPGGGTHTDDAIDWLEGQLQGARNVIAMREHNISARRARIARDNARTALIDVRDRITRIGHTARDLSGRHDAVDSNSREALELRIAAYRLLQKLADARDEETGLRITAGELTDREQPARLAETADMRESASDGLAATRTQLSQLADHTRR